MTEHEKQIRIRLRAIGNKLNAMIGEDKLEGYIEALGYDHSEKYVNQYENKQDKSTHEQEVYAESKYVQGRKDEIEKTYDALEKANDRFMELYKKLVATHKTIKSHENTIAELEAEEASTQNDRTDIKKEFVDKIKEQEGIIDEILFTLDQDLTTAESLQTKFDKLNDKDDLKAELDKLMESVKKRPEYVEKKAQEDAIVEEAKRESQRLREEQQAKAEKEAKEAAERAEAEKKRKADEEHAKEGEELEVATRHYGDVRYEISKELRSRAYEYMQENAKNSKLNEAINEYKQIRVKQITADVEAEKKSARAADAKSLDYEMDSGKKLVEKFFPENIPNLRERVDKIVELRDHVGTNPDVLDIDRHSTRLDQFSKMITVANEVAKLHHQTPRPGFFSRLFNTSYNKAYNREQASLDYFKEKLSRLDSDYVEKITGRGTCNEALDKEEMLDAFYDMKKREHATNDIMQVSQNEIRETAERDVKVFLVNALHNEKDPLETLNQYVKDNNAPAKDSQREQIVVEEANSLNKQSGENVKVNDAPVKVAENQKEM